MKKYIIISVLVFNVNLLFGQRTFDRITMQSIYVDNKELYIRHKSETQYAYDTISIYLDTNKVFENNSFILHFDYNYRLIYEKDTMFVKVYCPSSLTVPGFITNFNFQKGKYIFDYRRDACLKTNFPEDFMEFRKKE